MSACHLTAITPAECLTSFKLPPIQMALRAAATQGQQDDAMAFPLLRLVKSYLTVDELMPPTRLRWSRILGRPMMDRIIATRYHMADEVGPVYIEEVIGRDCLVSGRRLVDGNRMFIDPVPAATLSGDRTEFWYLRILDPLNRDVDFEQVWRDRYGLPWPLLAPFAVHPALRRLHNNYVRFLDAWARRSQEREETIYRQRVGEESDEDMSEESVEVSDSDMSD